MSIFKCTTIKKLRILLENGADPNEKDRGGDTLLHLASKYNEVETTKFLLRYGANPDEKNGYNYAPLHYASRYNYVEVVKVLLENGADPNVKDDRGDTPLHYAVDLYRKNFEVISILLKFGADYTLTNDKHEMCLHKLSEEECFDLIRNHYNPPLEIKDPGFEWRKLFFLDRWFFYFEKIICYAAGKMRFFLRFF